MTRAEKVSEAQRLRAEGLLLREIAERMGAKLNTVHGWLSDPDLAKQKARRARYSKPCEDCGKPTDGSGGYKVQCRLCRTCSRRRQHEDRRWTREAIIAALHRFHADTGRTARGTDLNPWQAERIGQVDAQEKRERFKRLDLPHIPTVQREFGSLNAAVLAAGFRPFDHALDHDWGRVSKLTTAQLERLRSQPSRRAALALAADLDIAEGYAEQLYYGREITCKDAA